MVEKAKDVLEFTNGQISRYGRETLASTVLMLMYVLLNLLVMYNTYINSKAIEEISREIFLSNIETQLLKKSLDGLHTKSDSIKEEILRGRI